MTSVATGLRVRPGSRFPLGATWDGIGTNFSLFSQHATGVELCLFDDAGQNEQCVPLREVSSHVWHGYLPGIGQDFKAALAFLIIMVVLLVRPQGLFGSRTVVRV